MGYIGKLNYEPNRQYHERVAEKGKKRDPFTITTVQNVQLTSPFHSIFKEQVESSYEKHREVKPSSPKREDPSSNVLAQIYGKGRLFNESV
ncbi:hypothetical protein [Bacillus niameyensis]|uniref:hypothetical protein n=1 Tax=Bacillus niameyensis TaxID=1522308 RepID=UPI0007852209|nr:hypothetical protein [Bacillus niameyensis]